MVNKHVEGTETAVNQDLVDDNLKKQRRNKREQLKKERRHQHLAEHVPVLVNGAEKPSDVEAARQVRIPMMSPRHTDMMSRTVTNDLAHHSDLKPPTISGMKPPGVDGSVAGRFLPFDQGGGQLPSVTPLRARGLAAKLTPVGIC
jgi:hypothetical protein